MHIPLRLSVDIFLLALGAALSYWIGAKNGQVVHQALAIGAVVFVRLWERRKQQSAEQKAERREKRRQRRLRRDEREKQGAERRANEEKQRAGEERKRVEQDHEHHEGRMHDLFDTLLEMDPILGVAVPVGLFVFGVVNSKINAAERQAERERELRQQAERRAEEERRRAEQEREYREALEQHMRDLGIDPADPDISPEDIEAAKRDINYDPNPNTANIAVAGNVNAGKSSLLNAIRNLTNNSPDWAPTGGSEVTRQRQRYPDPAHNCVWYDLPGAGTQSVTAFGYYYNQKLFAYDKIVLVHETTLTESDIRLLQVCEHFKQHCIVVRTKSDMHIFNYMQERRTPRRTPQQAREDFLSDVRQDVARFREQAEASQARFVPEFDDLVVSTAGVEAFVQGESSDDMVDEARFFRELERRDAPLGS
ncbi:Interferon-inducible GTPase 1 [Trichoderma lentiforme]|uniref:Interferon-inducible GTPase 1 n=1 Tax=Trichoderma lentiforme TaxID=1567552 RepID=A0A9P4X2Q4_9HYPO|nr:Interferon-inducible GTPase 1 [Trichoderma lentiforme]